MSENTDDSRQDIGVLSLEDFKMWSTMALKTFLSLQRKSVVGSIEVLAAR